MNLQFWPGAVVMMFIATMTASLVTNSGRSAWFVGVLLLMVYAIFAMTLYLLPPRVASPSKRDDHHENPSKRVLDPIDRVSEVLFGLIMVLTFTGSLSVAEAGRDDVRTMLIGALGCNVAWGIIDGLLYLMGCLAEKSRGLVTYRAVRTATDGHTAQRLIADALPPVRRVNPGARRTGSDAPTADAIARAARPRAFGQGRLAGSRRRVCLLVFVSTFPVVIPFMVMRNIGPAMRLSNAIAIVMLFLTGYAFGRVTGHHPWLVGIVMVVLGAVLVGITIALGG